MDSKGPIQGPFLNLGVSKNSGTPKSPILKGVSIINHPFWGTPIFWKPPFTTVHDAISEKVNQTYYLPNAGQFEGPIFYGTLRIQNTQQKNSPSLPIENTGCRKMTGSENHGFITIPI